MSAARGAVPAAFTLDACVDGSAIWLRNQLSVPVRIAVSGNSAPVVNVPTDLGVAALVTRARYAEPTVMLPGDLVRIPIGAAAATVSVVDTEPGGFYALAKTVTTFIPVGAAQRVYDTVADGLKEILKANLAYRNCLVGANWLKQLACDTARKATVTYEVGKMVVVGVARGALGLLLDFASWSTLMGEQVPSVSNVLNSERRLTQMAKSAGGAGGGSGGGPSPPPSGGSVEIPCPPLALFLQMVPYGVWRGLPPDEGRPVTQGQFTRTPLCVRPDPPYSNGTSGPDAVTIYAAATLDVVPDRTVVDPWGFTWQSGTTIRVHLVVDGEERAGGEQSWHYGWASNTTAWTAGRPVPWACNDSYPNRIESYFGC